MERTFISGGQWHFDTDRKNQSVIFGMVFYLYLQRPGVCDRAPIVAQISAIRVNLEGIGLLSLYKTKGPAITTTVIKIVPPRLLYLDKSVL